MRPAGSCSGFLGAVVEVRAGLPLHVRTGVPPPQARWLWAQFNSWQPGSGASVFLLAGRLGHSAPGAVRSSRLGARGPSAPIRAAPLSQHPSLLVRPSPPTLGLGLTASCLPQPLGLGIVSRVLHSTAWPPSLSCPWKTSCSGSFARE